jgi:hypothetical protein
MTNPPFILEHLDAIAEVSEGGVRRCEGGVRGV